MTLWERTKNKMATPIPIGAAVAGFIVVAFSFGMSQYQVREVSRNSRNDVKQVVENAYRACNALVKTREENIKQWDDLFDTLADVTQDPETDQLWEELRAQTHENLPHVNLDECVQPLVDD